MWSERKREPTLWFVNTGIYREYLINEKEMKVPKIKKKIIPVSNGPIIASIIYMDLEVPWDKSRV